MAPTSVCNVRVQYIRPLYKNLAEWTKEPDNVYVGRGGAVVIDGVRFPKYSSLWANPFKKGRDGSKADVLKAYNIYIRKKYVKKGWIRNWSCCAISAWAVGAWKRPATTATISVVWFVTVKYCSSF
jgi:hypothetical protein